MKPYITVFTPFPLVTTLGIHLHNDGNIKQGSLCWKELSYVRDVRSAMIDIRYRNCIAILQTVLAKLDLWFPLLNFSFQLIPKYIKLHLSFAVRGVINTVCQWGPIRWNASVTLLEDIIKEIGLSLKDQNAPYHSKFLAKYSLRV